MTARTRVIVHASITSTAGRWGLDYLPAVTVSVARRVCVP